ncbi:MAG: PilZ domain-containing protein, partial [Myxococcota bacterium]|nr:PilZ domain-containing protein [Myxococcota bacterium]
MSTEDRRTPGALRFPFEGLVEVGGAAGPSFEAQAVNVSEEGMQLRTTYLPEAGQPLTCRFDAGHGDSVLASGEVVWARGAEKGGEFGIRFTDLDAEGVAALKRIGALPSSPTELRAGGPGGKVRLHIDG